MRHFGMFYSREGVLEAFRDVMQQDGGAGGIQGYHAIR